MIFPVSAIRINSFFSSGFPASGATAPFSCQKHPKDHHKYQNMYPHYPHLHFYVYNLHTQPVRQAIDHHANCHGTDSERIPIKYIQKSRRSQFQIADDTGRHDTHNHLFRFLCGQRCSISFFTSILSLSILATFWITCVISPPVLFAV